MEQISKTDRSFITQKRSIATTQRMLNSTAIPTNTVEALKAWLRMEEKFTRLPMHFKVGSDTIPSITLELELKSRKKVLDLLFTIA